MINKRIKAGIHYVTFDQIFSLNTLTLVAKSQRQDTDVQQSELTDKIAYCKMGTDFSALDYDSILMNILS